MLQRDAIILMDSNPLYCDILILPKFVTVKHNKLQIIPPKLLNVIFFDDIIKNVFLRLVVIYTTLSLGDGINFPLFSD